MRRLRKYLKTPEQVMTYLNSKGIFNLIPDKIFLKLFYRIHMKRKLNIDKPITFNEKLQWLKLYNRNPKHTYLVDKYEVRNYIAEKLGEQIGRASCRERDKR